MFDRVSGTPEVNLACLGTQHWGLLRVIGILMLCNHTVGMPEHPSLAVTKTFTEVNGSCVCIGRFRISKGCCSESIFWVVCFV